MQDSRWFQIILHESNYLGKKTALGFSSLVSFLPLVELRNIFHKLNQTYTKT